jgi:hypothetical protein
MRIAVFLLAVSAMSLGLLQLADTSAGPVNTGILAITCIGVGWTMSRLFTPKKPRAKFYDDGVRPVETVSVPMVVENNSRVFFRSRIDTHRYRYWCPGCQHQLYPGPEGGCSVNAVCPACQINYGCLPDYLGD